MSPHVSLFPITEYWPFYLGFLLLVFLLLALDLGLVHRKAHAVSIREAATWSVVWVSLAHPTWPGCFHSPPPAATPRSPERGLFGGDGD